MTDSPETILVITPHPDDAESGAGGTIAKWTREGREVILVVCTNGDKGTSDPAVSPADLAATREREQLDAASVLGISDVVFLRFPDQNLEDGRELRLALSREIRKRRPGLVVAIDPNRPHIRHRDHYISGRVALDAVFPYARDYWAFPELIEEGLEPHKVPEVWLFRPEDPDVFIDITDTFDQKMEALHRHASQMSGPRETRETRARARAAQTGKTLALGVGRLAEPFKRITIF